MTATSADTTIFRFSRDELCTRDGLARWREGLGRAVFKLDLALLPDRPFHFETIVRTAPGPRVTFAVNSGLHAQRTPRLLADGSDDLRLYVHTSGTIHVSQVGREVTLGPSAAVLLSDAELLSIRMPSLASSFGLEVSRKELAPLVRNLDDAVMRPIAKGNEALRLLTGYIDTLKAEPLRTIDLQQLAAAHVRDLVAVMVGASRDALPLAKDGGIRAARLSLVKADISERLCDHNLTVMSVAARHRISQRYVQALFEREGTTFSEFVLRQRLARVRDLLADPGNAHQRIGDVAFDAGFGDLSYFNKAFRRRYGLTPSDVRAAAFKREDDG